MKSGYRISLLVATLFCLAGPGFAAPQQQGSEGSLYRGFKNPPKEYDLIPMWSWNGEIDAKEAKRQIDEMLAQGIKRAIVYPYPNSRIRFLSEDWWKLWGEILAYSREKGFQLGVNAENEHPDGGANDHWLDPPDQSLVLQGHPEYHMKRLAYVEHEFVGPGPVRFNGLPDPVIAVAARIKGPNAIDGESLTDLSGGISGSSFSGQLSEGNWRIMFFYLENTIGAACGLRIDPLNPAAVARFLDLTLGEYYRRFKEYFGTTFNFVLFDNEGDYGNHIAWTPALFDVFRAEKGYDLRKYLPLLAYEGGKQTPKVRIDYLRVISDLYAKNYWGQWARWCEQHGLQMTAQGWSESLQYDAAYGGDYMEIMRPLTMPGVEALGNRGRSPREFVENQSMADYERKRYWCEGPLVLGVPNYISPQKQRYATNMMGIWGIDLVSPQFYLDKNAVTYPPEVFLSQPFWKFFRQYTDYVRRISYMNGGGRHVVDLLLYRPIDTTFAYSAPLFNSVGMARAPLDYGCASDGDATAAPPSSTSKVFDSGNEGGPFGINDKYPCMIWRSNFAATVERVYFDLMELLTGYQRAYDVVDDYYLERMKLDHGALNIADLSFRGIVLPPMRVISRKALARIRQFFDEGGLVVAYGTLPSASSEEGWEDPAIARDIKAIFGVEPGSTKEAENQNAQGGKAFFVVGNVQRVLDPLNRNLRADLEVDQGSRERLVYLHRVKDQQDLYWIVNDTDHPRHTVVSLAARGKPELWDPATGERREVAYWTQQGRTVIPLDFHTWDATYLVFDPKEGKASNPRVSRTNLLDYTVEQSRSGSVEVKGRVPASAEKIYVEGEQAGKGFRVEQANSKRVEPQVLSSEGWRFRLEDKQVEVKYAREKLVPRGEGLAEGFSQPDYSDQTWDSASLSPEKETIRDWSVIGPFSDPNYGEGYNTVYPPEQKIDLDAIYTDANRAEVGWRSYHSIRPVINLSKALGLIPGERAVGYAATWIYAAQDEEVTSVITGKNVKLWINDELIFAMYSNPPGFELRDAFGHKCKVHLKAGWNQVLVKVVSADVGPALVFYLRLTDASGSPAHGLVAAWRPSDEEVSRKEQEAKRRDEDLERWYRVDVPAGTTALLLPHRPALQAAYLNGKKITLGEGRIQFPELDFRERPTLVLQMAGADELNDFLRFESGETQYHLGSWTRTGLTYYAGTATYERDFELAPDFRGDQILLDCGEVGVAVEIFLNGQKVGTRLWKPYSVDVTKFIKPGRNHLQIMVTNESDAAMRATPDFKSYQETQDLVDVFLGYGTVPYMDAIDINGLIGPVRLVPYREVTLSAQTH
jgi:hypothetical protein